MDLCELDDEEVFDEEGDEGSARPWGVGERSKEGSSVQSSVGTIVPIGGGTGDIFIPMISSI